MAASSTSSKKTWVTNPNEQINVVVGAEGCSSLKPMTIMECFDATAKRLGDKPALHFKDQGRWHAISFTDFRLRSRIAAKSLIKLGVEKFGLVGILGFNSPEWFITDLAAVYAGAIPYGIYTTNGPEACEFLINHSKSRVLVVENIVQVRKIRELGGNVPSLTYIVQYSGKPVKKDDDKWELLSWEEFLKIGEEVDDSSLDERTKDIQPGNCGCIIYTSGTTGPPKGVMLSHDSLTWETRVVASILGGTDADSWVSYLPLSHIAAKMVDIMACVVVGTQVYFAQPDALRGSLGQTLKEVRPTLFLGVPRVWEKIAEKLQQVGASNGALKRKIGAWAKKKGAAGSLAKLEGKSKPSGWNLANALVFKKVKAALGLDRCKIALVGAAPMSRQMTMYFMSLDIPVYEVFGMSESTGGISMTVDNHFKIGLCGQAIEGVDVRINRPDTDGNGEILFKGRNLMMGYLFNEEATAKDIDADGFFHTGDIGKFFDGNHIGITGRIKELIITAGGENIPPVPIEDKIKKEALIVSNCIVIGDKRKFLIALLTLKCEVKDDEPQPEISSAIMPLVRSIGANVKTVEEARKHPKIISYVENCLTEVNKTAVSNAHTIKKWAILPNEFTIAGNELGPTLKMKRRTIITKYDETIESLFKDT